MPSRTSRGGGGGPATAEQQQREVEEQNRIAFEEQVLSAATIDDYLLPRSMVQRLAKGVLSPNTILQKDALQAFTNSATVFINYLANSANDHTVLAGKKTIQPADVLAALKELEFEDFLPRCEAELERYNAIQCEKRNTYRRRVREEQAMRDGQNAPGQVDGEKATNGVDGGEKVKAKSISKKSKKADDGPAAKKARLSEAGTENGFDQEEDDSSEEAVFEDAQEQQDEDEDDVEEDEEDDEGAEQSEEDDEDEAMREGVVGESGGGIEDPDDEDPDDEGSESD